MSIVNKSVFFTTDNKFFFTAEEAKAHQFGLDNAALLDKIAGNYVNTAVAEDGAVGLVGRSRSIAEGGMKSALSYLIAQGLVEVELLAEVEAIEVSEELAARMAAVPKVERKKKTAAEEAPAEEADLKDFE